MTFDGTVHLGDVIMLVGFVVSGVVLYGRFTSLETKVAAMWDWWQAKKS